MTTQTIFKVAGATSQSTELFLVQKAAATSPGDPITGLAFNTSSLTAYYKINGTGTLTSITLATQTDTGAYSSGGFVETSSTNAPGNYRFDIPNACLATAGECTIVFNGATNMATHSLKIVVMSVDLFTNTYVAANTTVWNGTVLTGRTGPLREFGIIDSGTAQAATGTTLQMRSAASFADTEAIGATAVIATATTGALQSRIVTANVGSTDTLTVDTWTTTPTGTIVYDLFAGSPASATALPPVNATQIGSQTASASGTVTFPNATLASTTNITAGTITTATNLTNAPTAGDFTSTMKTSIGTAVAASAVASVTGNVGGNVTGSIGSLGATAKTDVSTAVLTTQMTEAYAADGVAPTLAQSLFLTMQSIGEVSVVGTTMTVKKLDGSTSAATYTLNDGTNPTSRTRAT